MSWTLALRPATFAGYPFYVQVHKAKGGQRLVVQELPYAQADLENTGPLPKTFTVTAYFLNDGWLAQREGFLAVLDASTTTQTLVLPTKGPISVKLGAYSYQDDEQLGAYGAVDFDVTVDASAGAPFANANFASTLLNNINGVITQISAAYQAVMGPIDQVAAIASYEANLLQSAASAVLALPAALLSGVAAAFTATPANPFATAGTVTQAFTSISDNAVPLLNPAVNPATPVSGIVPVAAAPADPSLGLAALAAWGANLAPAAAAPATLAIARAAVMGLVQQSAALALAILYAQTEFNDAQAAQAARAQLTTVMAAVGAGIVNAGQVDLYRAWVALGALANKDIIARAQNLPNLATYREAMSLPDVVLAQKLLQNGAAGDGLFDLNNAVHPLFMPPSGIWLEAA